MRHIVRIRFAALVVSIALLLGTTTQVYADRTEAICLNNEGVKALNLGNYDLAIDKFERALKADPTYKIAKKNLTIARIRASSHSKGAAPPTGLK